MNEVRWRLNSSKGHGKTIVGYMRFTSTGESYFSSMDNEWVLYQDLTSPYWKGVRVTWDTMELGINKSGAWLYENDAVECFNNELDGSIVGSLVCTKDGWKLRDMCHTTLQWHDIENFKHCRKLA